jgi:hypothetical protein
MFSPFPSKEAWNFSDLCFFKLFFWNTIYLWRMVVCFVLFCFVVMRSTKLECFRSCSWCLLKALNEEGCMGLAWFHDVWTCGAKGLEYWMISSLKIKLNNSWKFRRYWNVPLVLERSWWAGFNRIYLVRFGFRMWEILIFKWFLPLKIPKNQVLEGKFSWGCGNTWMFTIQFKLKELWCVFGVVGKILTIQV